METLKLGIAREKITPKVGGPLYGYAPDVFSVTVADELTVTAFYFQQGETKALMLSATVCLIRTELSREILGLIEEKFHVPSRNCTLCATHTHSGPNTCGQTGWGDLDRAYCDEIFIPAILAATERAIKSLQPVKMGVARGESLVGVNRRQLDETNRVILGQNPRGCFNPEMTVIAFRDLNGNPVANMIHYGAHGTAAGKNREITRDWSGVMIDSLEAHSGALTAFFNGPEGDVGPRLSNGKTVGDLSHVYELGEKAARDAVRIYQTIDTWTAATLSVSEKALSVPLQKRMPLKEAKGELEKYAGETVNRRGMMREHFETVIRSYGAGVEDQDAMKFPQTLIALGDLVFAAFPFELFSEIGLRINGAVKGKSVLSLSNTNGSEGYYITKDAVCRGGYEVDMFLYSHLQQYHEDADFYLMQETVKHIKELTEDNENV